VKTDFPSKLLGVFVSLPCHTHAHPLEDWQPLTVLPNGQSLNGIAFSDGQFVAVGLDGAIFTSTNALDWIRQNSGTSEPLLAIAAGNGLFIAIGSDRVLSSTNGTNWQPNFSLAAFQTNANYELHGFTYQNGKFFMSGFERGPDGNPKRGVLLSSTDAASWDLTEVPPMAGLNSITYISGKFLAAEPGPETILW